MSLRPLELLSLLLSVAIQWQNDVHCEICTRTRLSDAIRQGSARKETISQRTIRETCKTIQRRRRADGAVEDRRGRAE